MSVGDRIASKREELCLSQTELALRAGLKPPTISQYESEIRNPSYEALIKLSNALGVTTDYLIKGDQTKELGITGTISKVLVRMLQNFSEENKEKLFDFATLLVGNQRVSGIPIFERPVDYAAHILMKYADGQPRVNVYQIASGLGIRVYEQQLIEEEGLLLNGSNSVIILNCAIKNVQRKKFTLSILIGHALLPWHIKSTYSRLKDKPTLQTEDLEKMEAHEFAVSLLMPKTHIEKDLVGNVSIESLKKLATEKYDVSLFALANRIVEYDKEKYALLQSKDFIVLQTFPGKRPLVDKVNPNTFAGSFFTQPSEKEEIRNGEVPAVYWLQDAQPGEILFEETIYNPDLGGKALTLLTIKRKRK